jgi:GntR family transcriptional regulator
VSPGIQPDREERRALARAVAKRALLDARRNGLGVEELVTMIREVAAEGGGEDSPPASTMSEEQGAA